MATGTGKTRTIMALIDLFLRAHWAQKILFLADRDALVEQALNDGFKAHLPHEPRVRIYTANIDPDKRLYVATLQTMSRCFEKFSPGFFDLIIFDEAHRSIFNRFTEVIEYFDARMVGLTATPANFIDRDTFRIFALRRPDPDFPLHLPAGGREKRLVDFRLYQAQTGFQRGGIRGADLSEEDRNALIEQGIDPDPIDYAGTDLEVLGQQQGHTAPAVGGDHGRLPQGPVRPASRQDHHLRHDQGPRRPHPRGLRGDVSRSTSACSKSSTPASSGCTTALTATASSPSSRSRTSRASPISVDMLDTGVDIPEVVNLVFMKPVQSRIKLWQMIGRGTRNHEACRYYDRLPDGRKTEFLIIDFWQNDFGRQTDDTVPAEMPVLVRVFNTRLDLLEATLLDRASFAHSAGRAGLPRDARPHSRRTPSPCAKSGPKSKPPGPTASGSMLTREQIEFLRLKVGSAAALCGRTWTWPRRRSPTRSSA